MLACSQGYISPVELTATALASDHLITLPPSTPTRVAPTLLLETPTAFQTSLPTVSDPPPDTKTASPTKTVDPNATPKPPIQYYTQSGDTLPSILGRFGVTKDQIVSSVPIPESGLISPNILLIIPDVLTDVYASTLVMPDSEVVFSPSAADFDIEAFINSTDGFLKSYTEGLSTGVTSGATILKRVALENSINPRLLLALLEYKSHWVYGKPGNLAETEYPMGMIILNKRGLYHQLSWAVQQLSIGYYGWRAGILAELPFRDGEILRMSPGLNAGTASIQYLFAQLYEKADWVGALYGTESMPALMENMFGNYFIRAESVEPLYEVDLKQPMLELPFVPGRVWGFTGGPHSAWGPDGALAALDFAPPSSQAGCSPSQEWVTAMAPGVIVRAADGAVIEDLDFDGVEQTGWNIMYMHIETRDRIEVGTRVETNDKIGHPSCEGGVSTGTHTHVVRKYNGEWILADGPLSFVMSGFTAHNGSALYLGTLTNGTITVIGDENGALTSSISRPKN